MSISRRDVLKGAGVLAGATAMPVVFRAGSAFADAPPEAAARRRLVVIYLSGGNDGLNTVVPVADVPGHASRTVYDAVRPVLRIPPEQLLPLARTTDDAAHGVGLNPSLGTLHQLYRDGRVAIVQGVDYTSQTYSHFTSTDIWESGDRDDTSSGWIGRHLDRVGIATGELRAVAIGRDLPRLFQGHRHAGRVESAAVLPYIGAMRFFDGGSFNAEARARHELFAGYSAYPASDEYRSFYGRRCADAVGLVTDLEALPAPPGTGSQIVDAMLTARTMLATPEFGVECVYVPHYGGFDTHSDQVARHAPLLSALDEAIEAFYYGTRNGTPIGTLGPLDPALAERTLVMTYSEFGRTTGDNGSGTDHGAAAPLFVVGPPPPAAGSGAVTLLPGLHGEHPNMGSAVLPQGDLAMTTDFRRVYKSVLESWLGSEEPLYTGVSALPLFGGA